MDRQTVSKLSPEKCVEILNEFPFPVQSTRSHMGFNGGKIFARWPEEVKNNPAVILAYCIVNLNTMSMRRGGTLTYMIEIDEDNLVKQLPSMGGYLLSCSKDITVRVYQTVGKGYELVNEGSGERSPFLMEVENLLNNPPCKLRRPPLKM